MIEKSMEILGYADLISPIAATIQDFARGPAHTFLFPYGQGFSGHEIRDLLAANGITCWGLMIVGRTMMISVPKGEAFQAQLLFSEAGIVFENPIFERRRPTGAAATRFSEKRHSAPPVERSVRRKSPIGLLDQLIDELGRRLESIAG